MISALGSMIGLATGLVVCLIQEHFGILKLGSGTEYIISAYPVTVQASDIALIACIVLALGALAAWIPARQISIQHENN